MGTYGDRGNADVLAYRARLRDIKVELIDISYLEDLPSSADIYLLGGAEDFAQVLSAQALIASPLKQVAERGAIVLAVCAGFQIIGNTFSANAQSHAGIGLIDVDSRAPQGPHPVRSVGEVRAYSHTIGVELTGFENHAGHTLLGDGVESLGVIKSGFGNGDAIHEGAVVGNIFGTYLHGPVLARNPEFADLLLERATGANLPQLEASENELAATYAHWRRCAS